MKKLLVLLVLVLHFHAKSQAISVELNYSFCTNTQFDKAVRVYNSTRPFLTNKQPLFRNGMGAKIGYSFPSKKHPKVEYGYELGYSYFDSYVENDGFINDMQLHSVTPRFFTSTKITNRFIGQIMLGLPSYGMFRQINSESVTNNETPIRAFGIGLSIRLQLSYQFVLNDRISLFPTFGLEYCPFQYSPQGEALINQTKRLYTNNLNSFFGFDCGVKVRFLREKK
jgi:hypothetical protein